MCENRARHLLHILLFNLPTAGGHDHCAHFTDKATELREYVTCRRFPSLQVSEVGFESGAS